MTSLGLVNMAISSAIAAQPMYVHWDTATQQNQHIESDLKELADSIFMAERNLSAFYQLAYHQPSLLETFNKKEMLAMLNASAGLIASAKKYAENYPLLLQRLSSFETTLSQFTQLFEYAKYKQEMDAVMTQRVNGEIAHSFANGANQNDIRQALFGE
ncbi:hypothetical protein [Lonepinella sp. MS14437]|uniref:hypothetical protein n=1 Tax=unclassified Lonepinella TaxID=2642006 RepID=UPI0036DB0A50